MIGPVDRKLVRNIVLSDESFVEKMGGSDRLNSVFDVLEGIEKGLDSLRFAFTRNGSQDSVVLYYNSCVEDLRVHLNSALKKRGAVGLSYDDVVIFYNEVDKRCGHRDSTHFDVPQRLSYKGKEYVLPGFASLDFFKVEELNGNPLFFSGTTYEGKVFSASCEEILSYDRYNPVRMVNYGGIRFLSQDEITDWDYMLTKTVLRDSDGRKVLEGKRFYWDNDAKGLHFELTENCKAVVIGIDELKGLYSGTLNYVGDKVVSATLSMVKKRAGLSPAPAKERTVRRGRNI